MPEAEALSCPAECSACFVAASRRAKEALPSSSLGRLAKYGLAWLLGEVSAERVERIGEAAVRGCCGETALKGGREADAAMGIE